MSEQLKKINTVGNVLIRKFGSCDKKVICTLFRVHCSTVYCGSSWSSFIMTTYKKLKVCCNDILRRLLGVPRWASAFATFVQAGLDNIDVILQS